MLLALSALLWLAGTFIRILRQALFLQLEEYQGWRYFRWLLARRSRWLPQRPFLVWLVGSALMLLLAEAPDGDVTSGANTAGRAGRQLAADWRRSEEGISRHLARASPADNGLPAGGFERSAAADASRQFRS